MTNYQPTDGSDCQFPTTAKLAFYGATPVAARTSTLSLHSTSFISVSANITVGSTLAAWATEVTNTLVNLGIWT